MLFNSLDYLLFLPAVALLYHLCPQRGRVALLLVASYVFYMSWEPIYALLLAGSTLIVYVAGLGIGLTSGPLKRKAWLVAGLVGVLGILGFYKYTGFLVDSAGATARWLGGEGDFHWQDLILPLGISFFTFQGVGYLIDVYRGAFKPVTNLGVLALFKSFFPQLVAGPIERASHLLPQFTRYNRPSLDDMSAGFRLILWGLFKKVVVADRLAVYVDHVHAAPGEFGALAVLLAIYFFAFQIYCDFSGYSDIAIGSARVMGFDLMRNFRRPYFATSVREFWRRWHISLSTWFRDYVYLPLGGSRRGAERTVINLLAVFLISGLWHGAAWTFVAWGFVHGLYVLGGMALAPLVARMRLPNWVKIAVTFHLVVFAWLLFRAATFADVGILLGQLGDWSDTRVVLEGALPFTQMVLAVFFVAVVLVAEAWHEFKGRDWATQPVWLRWGGYYALAFALILFPGTTEVKQFVYFQF